jgi:ABC-2 type transport system permease protein
MTSNAIPEAQVNPQALAAAAVSPTQKLVWSVRREVWENRYLYAAPLIVAAVTVVGFLIATIGRALSVSDLDRRRAILSEPYHFSTALIMGAAFVVAFFYCLESLHGERSDRSILFWKSLPVSDVVTVLSKAAIPFVVLPVIAFVITVVTQWVMLTLSSLVLLASGMSAGTLWMQATLLQVMLLYHLFTVHVLWYAPIYTWAMLVSGWAKRVVILWAILPAAVICILEKFAFNTTHFLNLLRYRFSGPEEFTFKAAGTTAVHSMMHLDPARFFTTPGLWVGLLIAAIFLGGAVVQRRYRVPI